MRVFFIMPRNHITKQEIKTFVEKLKTELYNLNYYGYGDPKELAHKYLNKVMDKIQEYRE